MLIGLHGRQRARLRRDLQAHRETFSLNDADYAGRVLKISVNTLKKCLQPKSEAVLTLKRQTFVSIFANAGLDPKHYGLSITLPIKGSQYGGYQKANYRFLCGCYFLYRRSFLSARNITRSILEIEMNENRECLSFHELHFYVSDNGVRDEQHYYGDVYLNQERSILSLPAYFEGQVRLTLIHMPQRPVGKEKLKMRGAVLAFGVPKGYWQPTVSAVFIEGPVERSNPNLRDLSKTIPGGTEEFTLHSAELSHTEEYATIMTPLMWHKLQK